MSVYSRELPLLKLAIGDTLSKPQNAARIWQ
jgi:hypothetical protein